MAYATTTTPEPIVSKRETPQVEVLVHTSDGRRVKVKRAHFRACMDRAYELGAVFFTELRGESRWIRVNDQGTFRIMKPSEPTPEVPPREEAPPKRKLELIPE